MFRATCDILGSPVIVWASDLHGIVNTEYGIIVRYLCGSEAEMLTGAGAPVHLGLHVA